MLEVGIQAPDFTLLDKEGTEVTLSNILKDHSTVVLYFYPKDSTAGCTKQACGFRDEYEKYKELNVPVIGISKDSVKSHMNFANKQELPFILLSDPELKAIKDYDVWKEKKMCGKTYMGVVRTTYIIKDGIIDKVYDKVKAANNATEVLAYLEGK
ncbi:thioredoxin-dependent thiol peroxidase [uncultured Clostridium sp.]|uniref:thioredoxin-dependent thiol peroxidase n=1 Tax=uncultured Clostridium sp. TaxID=59620 RepID=UPI0025E2C676|nr:thioredoxin-dependent thiol peroxidase [uncultured Clostridium sp.]